MQRLRIYQRGKCTVFLGIGGSDMAGLRERKHDNTKVGTLRKQHPGFAEGVIRSDATLGTLKDKLGLPKSASLNDVKKELGKGAK
jgi:hypothetical protein